MSVLVIGQNPGNNPKTATYKGHTIVRLNEWCDDLGINNYSFANVVTQKGKVKMKDVDFDRLKGLVEDHSKVLALGVFASNCLSVINKSHFRLPHPSPLNRQMNDKKLVKQILAECKEYLI
jgi:hypothetical protein|tara:strand:- start:12471 stop:12833 length:363 start_codon:yes stop_codon:yes gene_type:complete